MKMKQRVYTEYLPGVRLKPETAKQFKEVTAKKKVSQSEVIRRFIENYVKKNST